MDLPAEQDQWCLRDPASAASKHRFYPNRYRRLDYDQHHQSALTKIDPSGKNGTILHPTLHRVLTVREQARAMGFPDWFYWDPETCKVQDMYKQIGNAVSIPIGRSLGLELRKALMEKWFQDRDDGGMEDDERASEDPSSRDVMLLDVEDQEEISGYERDVDSDVHTEIEEEEGDDGRIWMDLTGDD